MFEEFAEDFHLSAVPLFILLTYVLWLAGFFNFVVAGIPCVRSDDLAFMS
jgi:hypothetical protein